MKKLLTEVDLEEYNDCSHIGKAILSIFFVYLRHLSRNYKQYITAWCPWYIHATSIYFLSTPSSIFSCFISTCCTSSIISYSTPSPTACFNS